MKFSLPLIRPVKPEGQSFCGPTVQPPSILLTIDVEDWFQVENFKDCIPFSSWSSCESRVEENTHMLLDLFDSIDLNTQPSSRPAAQPQSFHATFFILGWVAERLPHLVREIHSRGHEVASHGYNHELCGNFANKELGEDLTHSKKLLEDIVGERVYGYRAPSFSINNDILSIVEQSGYLYDSSYNSFEMHGRYGRVSFNGHKKKGIAVQINSAFYEIPISNIVWKKKVIPWGGGGYFRLIPFPIFRFGVQSMLKKEDAYLFYCHPWEFDEKQPRVEKAAFFNKLRHYVNLDKTRSRLRKLIETSQDCYFISCKQYLDSHV